MINYGKKDNMKCYNIFQNNILCLTGVVALICAIALQATAEETPYDFMRAELAKINSSEATYIQSDNPFAPLVNAFVANARDDQASETRYLNQFNQTLQPYLKQKMLQSYSDWDKKKLEDAQNQITKSIQNGKLYDVFHHLLQVQSSAEFCYRTTDCKSIFLSSFSFAKIASQITPPNKYDICYDITPFYPKCSSMRYDDSSAKLNQLELAVNYAQHPMAYYKEMRVGGVQASQIQSITASKKDEKTAIPTGAWSWKEASMYMEANPEKAYQTFKMAKTLTERLQFALFLQAYFPDNVKEIKDNLRAVVQEFDHGDKYLPYSRRYDKETFHQKYASDLSDSSDPISMDYLIEVATSAADKSILDKPQYLEIYCGVAKKMPAILVATAPYYGSSRDYSIPYLSCDTDADYQKFPAKVIYQYANKAEKADGYFLSTNEGTIRFAYAKNQDYILNQAFLDVVPKEVKQYRLKYPYEAWSYQSLETRKAFLEIKEFYLKAQQSLMAYYQNVRHFSPEKSSRLTEYVLFNYPFGTRGETDEIPLTLRTLMIEGKSLDEVNNFISRADFRAQQKKQTNEYENAPLIHIAVQKPAYLKALFDLTRNMQPTEQEEYDVVSDVNARNNINKTPLMVAAQFNLLESAQMLLQAGADINAVTQTEEYFGLLRDNRTALMYAAENADLQMIQLLLNNGADKNMHDTRGYRAVDYLMGFASGQYNNKLSEEEFKQALKLLL